MKNLLLPLILLSSLLTGCAIGPIVIHETARTVGNSNHELDAGYGQIGYVFKWNYGLSENLDLGLHLEALSIGVRTKYAFINNAKNGWSLAAAAGTGASIGGSHYYGDLIGSYLNNKWEPYGTIRVVHVKNDPFEFKSKDTGDINFKIDKIEYNYGQFILGTRYWLNKNWLLSAEAATFFTLSSGVNMSRKAMVGAALGYRF